ncbi:MAG: hypothetical protein U0270_11125 [Labilithrix sp.]
MGWNVDGIVDEAFRALVYNAPSETLLAQFERKVAEGHVVESIYVRRRFETEYRKLFGADEFTSARAVVAAEAVPVAYFLIWQHGRKSPEGADWKALARIDLEALSVTEVITSFTGEWDGAWISQLQAVSADATSLFCTVGRPKARSGGNVLTRPLDDRRRAIA